MNPSWNLSAEIQSATGLAAGRGDSHSPEGRDSVEPTLLPKEIQMGSTESRPSGWGRPLRCATLLALVVGAIATGCLSRPALKKESFALTAAVAPPAPASGTKILVLRRVQVSPLFEGQPFVYRTGDQSYERDPYAAFLVPPARLLTQALGDYLRHSGRYADVIEPGGSQPADEFADVTVSELYGDFRSSQEAFAVLTLRFHFYAAAAPAPARLRWQKEISRRVPLKSFTAATLAAGWNDALAQIMGEVAGGLRE
jgi:cholesterol transport system auxiliary component